MKRTVLASMLIGMLGFLSCKKNMDSRPSITVEMSSRLKSHTSVPPKTDTVLEYIVRVTDMPGCKLSGGNLWFSGSNGLNVSSLKNPTIVISNQSGVIARRVIDAFARTQEPFNLGIDLGPDNSVDTVRVTVEAPNASIQGTLDGSLELAYSWNSGLLSAGIKNGQTTTFTKTSLALSLNSATPTTSTVVANGEREALVVTAKAIGQPQDPTSIQIKVDGTLVQETRVYIWGTNTLLGSLSYAQTGIVTKNIPMSGLSVPDGDSVILSVRHVLRAITAPTTTEPDIKTTLTSIMYTSADNITRTTSTTLAGSSLYVYNALPIITNVPLTTGTPMNGVPFVYKKWLAKTVGGNGAIKFFTLDVRIVDMGLPDTIRFTQLKLKIGGVPATNVGFFDDISGAALDSITASTTKVRVVFVSGVGQELSITNTDIAIELQMVLKGNNHPGSGDYASIQLLGDDTALPPDFKFLNRGDVPGTSITYPKFYSSPVANPSAVSANFGWTDLQSVGTHTGAIGGNSADWFNGYRVYRNTNPIPDIQYWYL